MLSAALSTKDVGAIRFASAPAPVVEMALMLFEVRQRPRLVGPEPDWRSLVRSAFPAAARPLFNLVAAPGHVLFLDVLTAEPEQAFDLVSGTAQSVHGENVNRIADMKFAPIPRWLRRYADGDKYVTRVLDTALRELYAACMAPMWQWVRRRFNDDIAHHAATLRRCGVTAMVNGLNPRLVFDSTTLYGPYPGERQVSLDGNGLVLMPSAFWTGDPLLTWDPLDPTRHVLIYPAVPPDSGCRPRAVGRDALGGLLGATRAAVLRASAEPRSTTDIAGHAKISLASASEHATVLREAGLILSARKGKATEHRLTPLGGALLRTADSSAL